MTGRSRKKKIKRVALHFFALIYITHIVANRPGLTLRLPRTVTDVLDSKCLHFMSEIRFTVPWVQGVLIALAFRVKD